MTAQPIHHSTEGSEPNKTLPSADIPHAYVENNQLFIMEGGQYRPASRIYAWAEWFWCASSPYASTQERARQIKAAMDEAYPQELAA